MNISQDNTVCIVTRLQAGGLRNYGSYPSSGKRFFFSLKHPPVLGTIQPGYWGSFSIGKAAGT
jgi:hypothetical protein